MRRAKVFKRTDGRWMALISEETRTLFYKALPTHAAALAWAISALEESGPWSYRV